MQTIKTFLSFLQENFEPVEAKKILSALPRERFLWNKVKDSEFSKIMLACYGSQAELWTPARIAMVQVFLDENKGEFQAEKVCELIQDYLTKYQALRGSISNSLKRDDLSTGLKIAYLVRYQFDVEKNYNFLSFLSLHTTQTHQKELSSIWRVVFSILDSILQDADEVYRTILNNLPTVTAIRLIIHGILTQPGGEEEQAARFLEILREAPDDVVHPFLRELSCCSPNFQLDELINSLLPGPRRAIPISETLSHEIPCEQLISFAMEQQKKAESFMLRGKIAEARTSMLDVKRLLAQVLHSTEVLLSSITEDDHESYEVSYQKEVIFESILIAKSLDELISLTDIAQTIKDTSIFWLKHIYLSKKENELTDIAEQAEKLLGVVQQEYKEKVNLQPVRFLFDYRAFRIEALELLKQNGELDIALEIAKFFYFQENYSPEFLQFLYQNHFQKGNLQDAKFYGELYHVLKPKDIEVQTALAKIAQYEEDWESAYQYNKSVIMATEDVCSDEWLMMATSAYKVGEVAVAMECCNKVIAAGYECGEVHTLQGMIYQSKGEMESALAEYDKAVEIDSKDSTAWKSLAEFYILTNRKQMAFNVLQNSLEHIPDSLILNELMGDQFIVNSDFHQAIKQYSYVIEIKPDYISSAEKLCACLWDAQQYSKLEDLLKLHENRWQGSRSIQYYLARLLLFKQDIEGGLIALDKSINFDEGDEISLRLYLETIVQELGGSLLLKDAADLGKWTSNFSKALDFILKLHPDEFEIRLINAEFQLMQGEWTYSKTEFEALTKYYEANLPIWKWRVQGGFGISALWLGLPNVAMAALQSASNVNQDETKLYIMLAEATYQAKLEPQALVIAQKICERARVEKDATALIWYVNFLSEAGETSLAIERLKSFIADTPEQKAFYIKAIQLAVFADSPEGIEGYLNKLESFEDLNKDELEFLANQFENLKHYDKAEYYYSKADSLSEEENLFYQLKRYQLCMLQQDYQGAYDRLVVSGDNNVSLFFEVLKVDALIFSDKCEQARTVLEEIIAKPGNWQKVENSKNSSVQNLGLKISENELAFHQGPEGIYLRYALVHRLLGNFDAALGAMEKALAFGRDNPVIRYCFLIMAKVVHSPKRLKQLPALVDLWVKGENSDINRNYEYSAEYGEKLYALYAEYCLSSSNQLREGKGYEIIEQLPSNHSRVLMLLARKAYLKCDFEQSERIYDEVDYSEWKKVLFTSHSGFKSVVQYFENDDPWWISGELNLGHYKKAWDLAQMYYKDNPEELNRNLMMVYVGAKILYKELFFSEVGVVSHNPGQQVSVSAIKTVLNAIIDDIDRELITEDETRLLELTGRLIHDRVGANSIELIQLSKKNELLKIALQISRSQEIMVNLSDFVRDFDLEDRELLQQAALSIMTDDLEQGLYFAKRALSISPGDPISRIIYAKLVEETKDYEGALQSIESALGHWEDEWNWHEWAARVAGEVGDIERQIVHQEILHKQFQGNHDLMLNLVESLLISGSTRRALKLLGNAADYTKELLTNSLNSLFVVALFQNEQYDKALEYLSNVKCEDGRSVKAYLAGAEIYLQKKEYDHALDLAQKAYEYNPLHPKTLLLLAKILIHEGHKADAESLLRQIDKGTNTDPDMVVEYLDLLKRVSGAEVYHQELFDTNDELDEFPEVLYLKAKEKENSKQHTVALSLITQAIQKDPGVSKYQALAGELHQEAGQLDQAAAHYINAINQNPNDADLFISLAKIQITQREIGKALETYRLGLKHHKNDFRLYYESALLLRENKQYQDAEYMFKQALSLQPENEEIRNQLSAVMALNFVHNPIDLRH